MPEPSVPARWTPETEQTVLDHQDWVDPYQGARDTLAAIADAGLLVTPELTAVREAALAYRQSHAYVAYLGERYAEPGECARFVQEAMPLLLAIDAAVDALEARTTGAGT